MTAPLPPGTPGLPFLGETFALLRDPFGFQTTRRDRHGPIFRSRILGREFVFLSGPEGMEAFLDPERVSRENGHPAHVRALFGGPNMGMLDGPRPTVLKKLLLHAFRPGALDAYLAQLEPLVAAALGRWVSTGTMALEPELQRLAIEAIALNLVGIPPGPEADALRADYVALAPGFLATPVNLPGTPFRRALKARDRVLERFRGIVRDRRARPGADGLSRVLAATPEDGVPATDEELVLELNHVFIAGYIVYALLAELLLRLHRDPALRERARAEVLASAGEGPLTVEVLGSLRLLGHLVMEAKRTAPIVPFAFGSVKRTFELGGYTLPEGWGVQMALSVSNSDPKVFAAAEQFDPDRYAPPREEHKAHAHAWHPQGSGPPEGHRCLGLEYSTVVSQAFLVHLLRDHDWEPAARDPGYVRNVIPAGFADGLRATVTRRS